MEVFPSSVAPVYPASITPVWNTSVADFGNGAEQRNQRWLYAKYDVIQKYSHLTSTQAQTLWSFYQARKGAYEAFYFFDTYVFDHEGLYIATGDGSTQIFDLPGKSTSSQAIYENGTPMTVTTDYTILTGGGDGAADRVSFVSVPASGNIYTVDFTGYLRAKVRFRQDSLSRENFMTTLFAMGVDLKGV